MSSNFLAAVTICIWSHHLHFGVPQNKVCHCFLVSPSICHEVMGPDAIILAFSMLSSKPGFSLSFFTLINRLFSSSLLSAMRVVSSAYLRLLILLPAILIPACDSSNLACVLKRNYIQNALFIIHLINSNFFQNYNS